MNIQQLTLALAASAACFCAQAANSINLSNYQVTGTYGLSTLGNTSTGVSGLEASAVTYARDRGTLFYVGDEGTGVVEISLTGQTLGTMAFNWANTGSSKHDTEGLAYLGNGVLVVTEERLYDAYRFNYVAGGSANLASSSVSISNATVGNEGLEGISHDPRNGSFVMVKQDAPQDLRSGSLSFAANLGGVATTSTLFNPTLMGLSTLSDIQTLSPVDALAGTAAADNLLILSLGSRQLIEVNRLGQTLSTFDLSNILPNNGIEGVTVDEHGTIYLVAEQIQDGSGPANPMSQLIVLSATPVPEPESWAMALTGFGLLGWLARRKKRPLLKG
ncbi:MAG: SdiA-regulated domain-containing protein [Aquabacterium sp.]|uniref:SdiA-regulated domain-containing protein n=1 Tax=Aquabacterium sp. TaxID=1872578 RepID=UPI0027166732|nr:SdiA-regulated domain-containing protein [Aquabacterium sp.]MDO9004757.1 SdiA-regulated domain-containing protein [Aquabacterium sp.]